MQDRRKIHLARAIAASIDQVLPPGFRCEADGYDISITETPGLGTTTGFGWLIGQGGDENEEIAIAAYAVLNSFQDFVIEGRDYRGDNWPGPREGKLPEPCALVTNGILEMWYGERDAPILTLTPVNL